VVLSSPMMATTRWSCSITSGTRTSSTPSGTPRWRPTVSRTFGGTDGHPARVSGAGSAAASTGSPSISLAFAAASRLAIASLSNSTPRSICSSVIALTPPDLQLHLPRHQQDKQFQKYRRLVPHHLLYRLAAAATEGKMHLADGVGVQRMTRTLGVSAKVSCLERRDLLLDLFGRLSELLGLRVDAGHDH